MCQIYEYSKSMGLSQAKAESTERLIELTHILLLKTNEIQMKKIWKILINKI